MARKQVVLAAKVIISGLLVTYALSRVDLAAAARILPDTHLVPLAAMLLANIFSRFLAAYRWYRLVKPFQSGVQYLPFLKLTFASSFYGQFLPGGGVEMLQVVGLARSHSSYSTAMASVFTDRAFGILTTTLFLVVGLSATHAAGGANLLPYAVMVSVGLVMALLFLINEDIRYRCVAILPTRWRDALLARIDRKLGYFDTFRRRPKLIVEALALAVVMNIVRIAMFYFGALALGANIPLLVFFLAVPSILFLLVLPISIGGIGVRESTLVFFFALYGLSEEIALVLGVLIYLGNIVVAIPGAWMGLQAARSQRLSQRAGPQRDTDEDSAMP